MVKKYRWKNASPATDKKLQFTKGEKGAL